MLTFGPDLRAERQHRGWSLTVVTMKVDYPFRLCPIELSKRIAHPGWRRRLTEAFGVSEDILFSTPESEHTTG